MQQFNSITIEQYNNKKGLTLIELLIAICIFALIIIGFSSIDTFSRYHVITSDRRAKLQNDASYVLGHMAKEIGKAIGDASNPATNTTAISAGIGVYIDLASDGSSAGDGRRGTDGDRWIGYRFSGNNFQYSSNCGSGTAPSCSSWDTLSGKITNFTFSVTDNYVNVNDLTACWDADGSPVACGSLDNPQLTMKNRIYIPAVSTH